ncbi:LysE family translocator [Phreatobacter sp. AB_2022a]|uniref:LysE family translocator n=1 Tax=Phreatobacter sp. AB_2022a TaxID=3003134 RepID=UPI002286E2C7|nr:LysE family translocator [Phreatobacter sp. AB_2022a]MCZ0738550.1 LysE family translocator [Phreatobacter sp. AB_2022a]
MELSGFILFCGVYAMATFSPGPAVAAVIARVLGTGLRRTAPFIWGIVAGDLVWFALVALGLAALAQNFHALFLLIKYAGVAYLLYLAYKLWTAPAEPPEASDRARGEGFKLFLGGLALTLGNAKVMVFFVSILPLVVDLAAITPLAAVEVAAMMMVILSAAMWTYALVAARARRFISSPRMMRLVNRGTGTMMAGAAVAVAARG